MPATSRIPAVDDVEVGSLLRDLRGDLYVVTRKDGIAYFTVELEDISDSAETGEEWDEREASAGWRDDCYPQVKAGVADPEVLSAIYQRIGYQRDVEDVLANIAPADHRTLYNTIAAVKYYGGKLSEAQGQVDQHSKLRAQELHKLVDIVGTQTAVAKLLGINQSTLSRALRERS